MAALRQYRNSIKRLNSIYQVSYSWEGYRSALVVIKGVDIGDGYYADMLLNGEVVSAYCETGDCALLYNYGITNVRAKVKLGYTYMEEYESTKTCTITDIELTPDQKI